MLQFISSFGGDDFISLGILFHIIALLLNKSHAIIELFVKVFNAKVLKRHQFLILYQNNVTILVENNIRK